MHFIFKRALAKITLPDLWHWRWCQFSLNWKMYPTGFKNISSSLKESQKTIFCVFIKKWLKLRFEAKEKSFFFEQNWFDRRQLVFTFLLAFNFLVWPNFLPASQSFRGRAGTGLGLNLKARQKKLAVNMTCARIEKFSSLGRAQL